MPVETLPPDYFRLAKTMVKDLRKERSMSYAELAERMRELGLDLEEQVLINKVNRGTYSADFFLLLLAALGVETLDVPNVKPQPRGPSALPR